MKSPHSYWSCLSEDEKKFILSLAANLSKTLGIEHPPGVNIIKYAMTSLIQDVHSHRDIKTQKPPAPDGVLACLKCSQVWVPAGTLYCQRCEGNPLCWDCPAQNPDWRTGHSLVCRGSCDDQKKTIWEHLIKSTTDLESV